MDKYLLFLVLSIPLLILSWRTIFDYKSHGFYRFFSWECIVLLLANNYSYWFTNPFSARQVCSWILLLLSIYPVVAGAVLLKKAGRQEKINSRETLFKFERTTSLVETGIYSYIRHPLYSSLLLLTWGILLKNPVADMIAIAVLSSVFLYLTAVFDEKECIAFFGNKYIEYMKRSKMFIPRIF
jgi:protein-S-isoprenylcysteine O-methyltransferase Ste14